MNRYWSIDEEFINYLLKNLKKGSVAWRVLFECVKLADWDSPHSFRTSHNSLAERLGRKKNSRFHDKGSQRSALYSTSDIVRALKRLSLLNIIEMEPVYGDGQEAGIIQFYKYSFKAMYFDGCIRLGWKHEG